MIRVAMREVLSRRTASVLSALGLLTASLGFIVLASTSQTSQASLVGDVTRAWQTPYDILVRPMGSGLSLEELRGLVRPNFLNGTNGGITGDQLALIRRIPGVQVAAPIAIAGAFYHFSLQHVDLSRHGAGAAVVAFRVTATLVSDAGYTHIPQGKPSYALGASTGVVVFNADGSETLTTASRTVNCPAPGPARSGLLCFAPHVQCAADIHCPQLTASDLMPSISFDQPVIIGGIDPVAESELTGLDHCISSGRDLQPSDTVTTVGTPGGAVPIIPVIYSTTSFIDESLHVHADRIVDPPSLSDPTDLARLAGWSPVQDETFSAQDLYRYILTKESPTSGGLGFALDAGTNLLVPGDVSYRLVGEDHLQAGVTTTDPTQHAVQAGLTLGNTVPDLTDTWFRPLTPHPLVGGSAPGLQPVGQYDPSCVAAFDPLAGGRLEIYAPPDVRLPDGRKLGPNGSVAGYVDSPPALLTTLSGISYLDDPSRYRGTPGSASISAIRIRVADIKDPGPQAEARLARLAAAIVDQTGLKVDIVKGASPRTIAVDLPAGLFGRPALTVMEPWSVKGVSFRLLRAVSTQNIAMFSLMLAGAAVLVGQTSYVAVRRRRGEFGVLRAMGWSPWRIGALVEVEVLTIGLTAGALATTVGLLLTRAFQLQIEWWQLALATPLAALLAALASAVPSVSASRRSLARTMTDRHPSSHLPPPRTIAGVGFRELMGPWRVEALFGVFATALGAALLGCIVLVGTAFSGQLDPSRLGVDLANNVHPFHIALALLTSAIGAAAVAEVVLLSYLERRTHYGVLRALGWPIAKVSIILTTQALVIGALGGGVALAAVAILGVGLGAGLPATLAGGGAAVALSIGATAIAALAPLTFLFRSRAADLLRGE